MVKLLLTKTECIADIRDRNGDTPLHLACNSLNDPIIRYLIASKRANLGITNGDDRTPRDVLNQKAKQAGQLTRFIDLIDSMGAEGDGKNQAASTSNP